MIAELPHDEGADVTAVQPVQVQVTPEMPTTPNPPQPDKKKGIIEDILHTQSDEEPENENDNNHNNNEQQVKAYKHLTLPRHFDKYTYHIPRIELKSTMISQKLSYLMDEALSDLGFRNVASIEFWISLMVLLVTLWIRSYMHSFGSWLILIMTGTPVTAFDTMLYGFNLGYATRNVGVLVGVVLFGNLFNTLLFIVLIMFSWSLQRCLKRAPKLIYKFVASYGITTVVDYFFVAMVDICRLVILRILFIIRTGKENYLFSSTIT